MTTNISQSFPNGAVERAIRKVILDMKLDRKRLIPNDEFSTSLLIPAQYPGCPKAALAFCFALRVGRGEATEICKYLNAKTEECSHPGWVEKP